MSTESCEGRPFFEKYQHANLPPSDKDDVRQLDTATLLISAGFETTGFTIETAVYHLLAMPTLWHRLKQELAKGWHDDSDTPKLATLEKLPYLRAVVQESLRLSIGVMARLPRINQRGSMRYGDWIIPKGTRVSMSQKDIHFNSEIFPDPGKFNPERWMEGEKSARLSKYLVSFSRGARRCLGMK
jgi:cytochrome P450